MASRIEIDKSHNAVRVVQQTHSKNLLPKHKVYLAQWLINDVLENDDFSYGNFEAAKATKTYVVKARNALRGLSLS